MKDKLSLLVYGVWRIVSSQVFFAASLIVSVLQGLWYALSFKPWIYDEGRHFANIELYTQRVNPFISTQDTSWDVLGAVTRDGSYLFYYLMSWPLRFIQFFTDNQMIQYVGLRLICVGLFVAGIIVMRKALIRTDRIPKGIINLSLIFFILTPAAGLLAGIINYDNLALLLFSTLIFLSVGVINSLEEDKTGLRIGSLVGVISVGLVLSVVKWSALALFVPVGLFIAWVLYRHYGGRLFAEIWNQTKALPRKKTVGLVVILLVSIILFVERPVANVLVYGSPSPSCDQVIGDSRCQSFRDYVVYQGAERNKSPDFRPVPPTEFITAHWFQRMSDTMTNLLEQDDSKLPSAAILYHTLLLSSVIVLLVALRELLRQDTLKLLVVVVAGYVGALILQEYSSYLHYGGPVAIRARYLVPVLPIYIALSLLAIRILFKKHTVILAVLALFVFLLLSQSGGIVTHLFTVPDQAYWGEDALEFNNTIKEAMRPLVNER